MFKGLRNTFLFLHMGIVTAIIVVFFGSVWFLNYQGVMRRSDEILARDMNGRPAGGFGFMPDNHRNPRFSPSFTVELNPDGSVRRINSVFSTVELNPDGSVRQINSVFPTDERFYLNLTAAALEKSRATAVVRYEGSHFKYLLSDRKLVFMDISGDIQMLTEMGATFLWITLPLLLVLFSISLFFANRSIKPVEESYNKQKEFIADASHELKTPLAAISANVDVLLPDAADEQRKWLSYIKTEIERMTRLTQSLLFLTRLDYDRPAEDTAEFDFSGLVEDCLLPLEAVFYENKIRTEIDISPGIRIHGNAEQIRRLAGTLIDNAVKYNGGLIRVCVAKRDHTALLTVSNDGGGISRDELDKIWNRFYRGDKSRTGANGFGLGLPIAKAIAEKHGGHITAESAESGMSHFTVKLPLKIRR